MKQYLLFLLLAFGCSQPVPRSTRTVTASDPISEPISDSPVVDNNPVVTGLVEDTSPEPQLSFLYSVAVFDESVVERQPTFCFDNYTTAGGPVYHEEEVVSYTIISVTDPAPCYKRFVTQKVYGQCIRDPRDLGKGLWLQEHMFYYLPEGGSIACAQVKGTWIPAPGAGGV